MTCILILINHTRTHARTHARMHACTHAHTHTHTLLALPLLYCFVFCCSWWDETKLDDEHTSSCSCNSCTATGLQHHWNICQKAYVNCHTHSYYIPDTIAQTPCIYYYIISEIYNAKKVQVCMTKCILIKGFEQSLYLKY